MSELKEEIDYLSERNFMSFDDARCVLENAETWSGTKIRDTSNQEIINLLRSQVSIRVNNESIIIPIDYDIVFKSGFQPDFAVSFSQFGRKPQSICHFAVQTPVILEGKFKGYMKDIAYLLPLKNMYGMRSIGLESKNASKSNNEILLKILDGIKDNSSDIKDVSRDIKDVSLNVKDLLLKQDF